MTAVPSRALPADAVSPPALRLAAAAASAHPADAPRIISWDFPALPAPVAEAARSRWGVTVVENSSATDPRTLPAFATLFAHARSEQIIRGLARRTNLVLPAASALVIGDGPLAETLSRSLTTGGTRVHRGIGDPLARLRAHLDGIRTTPATTTDPWPAADLVIATGEGHAPIDAADLTGVVIDASVGATPASPGDEESVRRFVRRLGTRTWVVDAPDPYETGHGVAESPTRIADLLIALSILRARSRNADPHVADRLLAELVLS